MTGACKESTFFSSFFFFFFFGIFTSCESLSRYFIGWYSSKFCIETWNRLWLFGCHCSGCKKQLALIKKVNKISKKWLHCFMEHVFKIICLIFVQFWCFIMELRSFRWSRLWQIWYSEIKAVKNYISLRALFITSTSLYKCFATFSFIDLVHKWAWNRYFN